MLRQYELVERVRAYDPDVDEALLNRAYVFTVQKHGSQKRASGDPYFSHPVEVAGILTDLHLDSETIVTALLHDTLEDTLTTPDEIERLFGSDVGRLVDGVTKLSKIEAQTEDERAAEAMGVTSAPGGSSIPSRTSSGGYMYGCRIMFWRPAWAFCVSTPRKPLMRPYSLSKASPISSWIILGLRFMVSEGPRRVGKVSEVS